MTIANGQTITAADVRGLTQSMLATLQTASTIPLAHPLDFAFHNLTAGVISATPYVRRRVFVSPFDAMLETVAVTGAALTPNSVTTVTLEGVAPIAAADGTITYRSTNSLDIAPVVVTLDAGSGGSAKAARVRYRGGRARVSGAYLSQAPVARTIMMGSTYLVTVDTTSASTTSLIQVTLGLRTVWGRA